MKIMMFDYPSNDHDRFEGRLLELNPGGRDLPQLPKRPSRDPQAALLPGFILITFNIPGAPCVPANMALVDSLSRADLILVGEKIRL